MKTIYSITMVKNEVDIIEVFIRYNLNYLDKMVILDNGSTDGTTEIILKLVNEGLPIDLVFDHNPAYVQSEIITNLMYDVIRKYDPTFILPLDVDEFLTSYKEKDVRKIIKQLPTDAVTYIEWVTYVPTEKDDSDQINILHRINHTRKVQFNYDKKIIIPISIVKNNSVVIKQGSHDLEENEKISWKKNIIDTLNLAHYPVRSVEQMKSKYLVGWLANLARPKQVLFDWYYYFNMIKSGKNFDMKDLTNLALYYDVIDKNNKIGIIKNPIDLEKINNISLRYTEKEDMDSVKNVINYAENLAIEYSSLRWQQADKLSDQNILDKIQSFLLIDGWLSIREACELYRTVKSMSSRKLEVAEIGSWLGRSSFVLAKALEGKDNSLLHCIDCFDGSGDNLSEKLYKEIQSYIPNNSLLSEFTNNMRKNQVLPYIQIHQGYSYDVIKKFKYELDLLFIDGNHDYSAVLKDYQDWSPLLKVGGYIAFHDVGSSQTIGPKQVVERYIADNSVWGNHRLVDELYVAQKLK